MNQRQVENDSTRIYGEPELRSIREVSIACRDISGEVQEGVHIRWTWCRQQEHLIARTNLKAVIFLVKEHVGGL